MTLILRNGTLIDGNGGPPLRGMEVTLAAGRIERIAPTGENKGAPDVQVIDCTDQFILPGLIDSHVHLAFEADADDRAIVHRVAAESDQTLALREAGHALECLLAGITTVRDCGGRGLGTLVVRDAIAEGLLPGPRVLASGMPITPTFGHLYFCGLEVDGVEAMRVAARQLAKDGVDFIKVMATGGYLTRNARPLLPQYSQAELDALGEEARRLGKRVAAHVVSAEGIKRCVQAGINTLEHCLWSNPDGSSGYDPRVADQMATQGIAAGLTVVGTARNKLLLEGAERQRALEILYESWQNARKMRAAGVPLMLSSDAGVTSTPFREVYLSVQCYQLLMDVSPLEALRAITLVPAQVLGLGHELGTVEVGKCADLLILAADPLQDLSNLRRVAWVIRAGKPVVQGGRIILESS